jgi:hypothetical protein
MAEKLFNLNLILVLAIAALVIYILYRMIQKNKDKDQNTGPGATYSDESTPTKRSELNNIEQQTGSGIVNFSENKSASPYLRDYCIKASSNSAYSGGYMNLDMIKYVLRRGCRFLDFEVYVKDKIPVVAYSNAVIFDPSYNSFTSYDLPVSLVGCLNTCIANAFTTTSPNPNDPLFIQLRIKTNINDAFGSIAQVVDSVLKPKLYKGEVSPNTHLADLLGQVVLIIDRTTTPGYKNFPVCETGVQGCYNLKDYVNMESGSNYLRIYTEKELTNQMTNPPDPGVYLMRIVTPNSPLLFGAKNSKATNLITDYGAQIVAQDFYINDSNLKDYETMFFTHKSAFVPIRNALEYIKNGPPK